MSINASIYISKTNILCVVFILFNENKGCNVWDTER